MKHFNLLGLSMILVVLSSKTFSQTNTFPSSGNVGIGTTTPEEKLQISSGNLALNDDYKVYFRRAANTEAFMGFVSANEALRIGNTKDTYDRYIELGGMSGSTWTSQLIINTKTGNVGIGTTDPGEYKLNVIGTIRADEVVVTSSSADFVFNPDYKMLSLPEVEKYIDKNKHLPDFSAASEIKEKGMNVSEMQTKLLQKVEELTLYVIELNKKIEKLESEKNNKF
jgi:hypothetical protein